MSRRKSLYQHSEKSIQPSYITTNITILQQTFKLYYNKHIINYILLFQYFISKKNNSRGFQRTHAMVARSHLLPFAAAPCMSSPHYSSLFLILFFMCLCLPLFLSLSGFQRKEVILQGHLKR